MDKKLGQSSISPETDLYSANKRAISVSESYFEQIKNEVKTVEVRRITQESGRGRVGQIISYEGPNGQTCKRRISEIRRYKSFSDLAKDEEISDILPGKKTSPEELTVLATKHFKNKIATTTTEYDDLGPIEITRETQFEAWDLEPVEE